MGKKEITKSEIRKRLRKIAIALKGSRLPTAYKLVAKLHNDITDGIIKEDEYI